MGRGRGAERKEEGTPFKRTSTSEGGSGGFQNNKFELQTEGV